MLGVALPCNSRSTIPPDTSHAVSASLPTWEIVIGYEKGESWVVDRMQCSYPRFFIHPSIQRLATSILSRYGIPDAEKAMLFPSKGSAARCIEFIIAQHPQLDRTRLRQLDFLPRSVKIPSNVAGNIVPRVSAVIYPRDLWQTAKTYWQHSGDGISSRHAEFCQRAFDEATMAVRSAVQDAESRMTKGPRRYQHSVSMSGTRHNGSSSDVEDEKAGKAYVQDSTPFIEESKHAANSAHGHSRDVPGSSVNDVYLHSCGMNAIFTAHRILRLARGEMKSIMYGFPYVDTLKILEKWGPGVLFYGFSNASEIDDLEKRLESGERYLALFCEFPGNPLLRSPNLQRIRRLADRYDFGIIVDETIGNSLNIHVLSYADIIVSSLTKIFSGDSNVMGGAMVLNPNGRYYTQLTDILVTEHDDNLFEEDSIFLERNSRDSATRLRRINANAEVIAETLCSHPRIKQVYYPKYSETKAYYDTCKLADGGYGGLLSCTFHSMEDAATFYNHLNTQEGPSLGTNFTLSSPFVILAHFNELDWAAEYGCEASLVRFSVGLEEIEALRGVFQAALAAIGGRHS